MDINLLILNQLKKNDKEFSRDTILCTELFLIE